MHFDLMKIQHNGIKHAQVELLAKIQNPGNLKLQTPNHKLQLQFAVSHEKPDAKGLYSCINTSRKMETCN